MDPYKLYTLTADKSSEITRIWNILGLMRYATLIDIEDGLNDFFMYNNCIRLDPSGGMYLQWSTRDGSRIQTTPATFKTWFFTGVKPVDEYIPVGRPSTPIEELHMEQSKIEMQLLEELLEDTE
jgi:hypothetical protein